METSEILVDKINFSADLYPRFQVDMKTVEQYKNSIEFLPPIDVSSRNGEYILIGGAHRLKARRDLGFKTIKANIHHELDNDEIFELAVKDNAKHGLPFEKNEKKSIAIRLYKIGVNIDDIAEILSLSVDHVTRNYLRKILDDEKKDRDSEILRLWLNAINSNLDIAKIVGVDEKIVRITSEKSVNTENSEVILDQFLADIHQKSNHWHFTSADPDFGTEYPGRLEGQIIENLLFHYTDIGDIVLDPFVGGGTTIDVCSKWYRRFLAYDISDPPIRKEIIHNDITQGIPLPKSMKHAGLRPKLIILDPPYWSQKKGDYTSDPNDLSNMSLDVFYEAIGKITKYCYDVIDDGSYVAFIISNSRSQGSRYHLIHNCEAKFYEAGFRFKNAYSVPYGRLQSSKFYIEDSKKPQGTLTGYRILTVFEK